MNRKAEHSLRFLVLGQQFVFHLRATYAWLGIIRDSTATARGQLCAVSLGRWPWRRRRAAAYPPAGARLMWHGAANARGPLRRGGGAA
jgi:hypothetical protein